MEKKCRCKNGKEFVHELLGQGNPKTGEKKYFCSGCSSEWTERVVTAVKWRYENGKITIIDDTGYTMELSPESMNSFTSAWMNFRRAIKVDGLPEDTVKEFVVK